jgi:hypothetical protein
MCNLKFVLLGGLIEISSNTDLPVPLVYAMSMVLIAIAVRILFGLPFASLLRRITRVAKHLKNRAYEQ